MRRRGAEAVDVVMSPFERAKASAAASKHFFLLLLGMQADGGCTHLAFTDGSKVGAEASRDGAAHAACGVFEGASLVCGAVQGDYNYNYVSVGEPNAFRAYGCGLPAEAEVPDTEMTGIILFLERCVHAAEETGAEPVHAIVAVDSEACLVDIEIAWRAEDARALAPRNRAALLETICALRKQLVAGGRQLAVRLVPGARGHLRQPRGGRGSEGVPLRAGDGAYPPRAALDTHPDAAKRA